MESFFNGHDNDNDLSGVKSFTDTMEEKTNKIFFMQIYHKLLKN